MLKQYLNSKRLEVAKSKACFNCFCSKEEWAQEIHTNEKGQGSLAKNIILFIC